MNQVQSRGGQTMSDEYTQGAEESEFKGNPMLVLNPDSKYPFQFGLSKAKLILEHIEDIEQFVDKYDENSEE